jgi:hypothetical protein
LNFFSDGVNWEELENSFQQIDWSSEFENKDRDNNYNHFVTTCKKLPNFMFHLNNQFLKGKAKFQGTEEF